MGRRPLLGAPVWIAVSLSLALGGGCFAPSRVGWFDDHAFYAARQHYRVRYLPGAEPTRALMSERWVLDNFTRDGTGRPGSPIFDARQMARYEVDTNSDGIVDRWIVEPEYELHFEHADGGAMIWMRSMPLQGALVQRSLPALCHDIVDAMVTGSESSKWMEQGQRLRLGARIVDEGPATFANGTPAHRMIVELHDLDVPEGNAGRVGAVLHIVLARPAATWNPRGTRGQPGDPPIAVFFGYAARPDQFGAYDGEFEALLARTDFR
jgi:hypothetical protein